MNVCETAYAKINLYLNLLGKRNDGYHEILTVMQTVNLADRVEVKVQRAKKTEVTLSLTGECEGVPCDGKNLVCRAASAYLEAVGRTAKVEIRLEKRIPVAAGLAGGSADAAAVLRAMNRIFDGAVSREALSEIAAGLGSDVPFCLVGGKAVCTGRGEKMTPLRTQPLHAVITAGEERLSTPTAYRMLDEIYRNFDGDVLVPTHTPGQYPPFNIFEEAVLPVMPSVAERKAELSELGADPVLMSGSGPTVFGLFKTAEAAEEAAVLMRERGRKAFCVEAVDVDEVSQEGRKT